MKSKVIVNRGTGAGGLMTNINGKEFEKVTNIEKELLNDGFKINNLSKRRSGALKNKKDYFLEKTFTDKKIIYMQQTILNKYLKLNYNIESLRNPDEAYLIIYNSGEKHLKILEKKCQNVQGSVETKLWASPSLKREYEYILPDFKISYSLCVNNYLKSKFNSELKYKILTKILNENNINVFYGDELNYYDNIIKWIYC